LGGQAFEDFNKGFVNCANEESKKVYMQMNSKMLIQKSAPCQNIARKKKMSNM